MFAIVNIGGSQYKVSPGNFVYVNRLQGQEGDSVSFEEVTMLSRDGNIEIGTPFVNGTKVSGTILQHLKDDKVIVFKKKRRKGYKVKKGHRQHLTKVKIENF